MRTLLAALFVATTPFAVSAATLTAGSTTTASPIALSSGSFESLIGSLAPSSTISFDYSTTQALSIDLVLSGTGDISDLITVSIDYGAGSTAFDTFVVDTSGPDGALVVVNDFIVSNDFSIMISGASSETVSIAGTLLATAYDGPIDSTSPVPVPASALLLVGGLGGLGLMRRKKK